MRYNYENKVGLSREESPYQAIQSNIGSQMHLEAIVTWNEDRTTTTVNLLSPLLLTHLQSSQSNPTRIQSRFYSVTLTKTSWM